MTEKTETKTGVVQRKRGVNHNDEHYPMDTPITLPADQYNDWLGAGIIRAAKAGEAKNATAVNNAAKPPEAGDVEAPKTI